ncbi:FG-GAP repeat domain-containing protein [Parafilimonas sp.]|uniref:FG-GAP repeat domain-containing protein n=1 Tax=Parafilimonas sp. TaxID=1969739 RepID=UPI0039E691D5
MSKTIAAVFFLFIIILSGSLISAGCGNPSSGTGRLLAKKYCGSCHVFPGPELLPQNIWQNNILPAMGVFANFYRDRNGSYHPMTENMISSKDPVAHTISLKIDLADWNEIVQFYLKNAPQQLKEADRRIDTTLPTFGVLVPPKMCKSYTSSVYAYTGKCEILVSRLTTDSLIIFNKNLQYVSSAGNGKGIVDVSVADSSDKHFPQLLFTHIGSFGPQPPPMNRQGFVEITDIGHPQNRKIIADSLDRPVKSILTDVNNDGLKDLIVCQFGFLQGELSLFLNNGKTYTKKTLSRLPGAIDIQQDDINQDGLPDFWVLFAAAYEGIIRFINKGNGEFEQYQVMDFPPCYGSTSFQLVDFNKDGRKDILYTCGDNADYSQVLKPYHGVYLFENTGIAYKQAFFFPLNGCFKAVTTDYDMDGDMDIAAIAFFADYDKHPEEGFVYLENKGNGRFEPHTFPIANTGRWSCMEAADYDGDGDTDILIGNLAAKPGNNRELMLQWMNSPEFLVLRNKTR